MVVPEATPVTTPVLASTVATPVLLDVHTPPVVALLNAVVEPTHTSVVPLIAATTGNGVTFMVVTALAEEQPFALVTVTE